MENQKPQSPPEQKHSFRILNAEFKISVSETEKIPDYQKPEIAIAGKSNVGKSSFINFITNRKKLARTSADPGRTRLLNFFSVNSGDFYFVDLPGYGFAKVAKSEKAKWGNLIEGYLLQSKNLKNVFVLVDSRLEPSDDDKMLLQYLKHYLIDFTVVATKCDKLSKLQTANMKSKIANTLGIGTENVIMTSAQNRVGLDDVLSKISQILE